MIKTLRSQKRISQEALAEMSGLSLRTIQRVEAGHRVSYSSLRALAKTFSVDVDELEWELYAMDKSSNEFIEAPLWVRLVLRTAWYSTNRKWSLIIEKILALVFILCFLLYLTPIFDGVKLDSSPYLTLEYQILIAGFAHLMAAYCISFYIRLSDKYQAWRQWETSDSSA